MIVVRTLLNSWATLDARAPTLLSRWACRSCRRSWSASLLGASTSSLVMKSPPPTSQKRLRGKVAIPRSRFGLMMIPPLAKGIGCAAHGSSLEDEVRGGSVKLAARPHANSSSYAGRGNLRCRRVIAQGTRRKTAGGADARTDGVVRGGGGG